MIACVRSTLVGFCMLGLVQMAAADAPIGSFTYQGALELNGMPIDNASPGCDCTFSLWDQSAGGTQLGTTQTILGVPVDEGAFTVHLNSADEFGPDAFNGAQRYLEIAVACPSGGTLELLTPRQPITAAPYALRALSGPDGHSLDAADGDPVDAVFVDNAGNVGVGTTTPGQKLSVDGNIELTSSGGGRTIGLPIVNFGGRDLTLRAGGNASSHEFAATGGNLILRAGHTNRSGSTPPPIGTSDNNDVMIYAGDNVFDVDFGDQYNGNIRFFAGDGLPERMRVTGDTGGVGIDTTSPAGLLDVSGDFIVGGDDCHMERGTGGCNYASCQAVVCAQDPYCCNTRWDAICAEAAATLCQRGVGVGRVATTNALEVEGTASKTTAGDWLANSDASIKTDVTTITNALETLERLRPVRFRYTDDYKVAHPSVRDHEYVNYVAQEFREVFPDQVQSGGDGILQVDTYPAGVYAVAAIQELHEIVRQKEAELECMEAEKDARIAELTGRLERLEAMLEKVIVSKDGQAE